MKKSQYLYRISQSGIQTCVKITAYYDDYRHEQYQSGCLKITDNLFLADINLLDRNKYPYAVQQDLESIKLGLLLVSEEISKASPFEKTVIGVDELIYLLVDYVPQSIPAVIIGWAKETFGFSIDENNHILYYFKWIMSSENNTKPNIFHKYYDCD